MNVAFTADKGGVGKSLLAFHVATRLRQLGRDVALVDLDQRSASSAWAAGTGFVPAHVLPAQSGDVPPHEVLVWDTPAHPSASMKQALQQAMDLVVVVASHDLHSQLAARDLGRELGGGTARVVAVVNNVHANGHEGAQIQDALRRLGVQVLRTSVRSYRAYVHAQRDGRAVCDWPYARADEAWSDIAALTDEILETIHG